MENVNENVINESIEVKSGEVASKELDKTSLKIKKTRKKKRLTNDQRENLTGLAFISPWIIGFLIFGAFPICYSLFLSFNNVIITSDGIVTNYIGIDNFRTAFTTDRTMIAALISFLKESVVMVFVINVFAVLFAVILNGNIKGRGFFRTIFFLPVVIVSGPVMKELLDKNVIVMSTIADFSIVNLLGQTFGANVQSFIVKTFENLVYMFWFSGVQLIVYLTVLQKMDHSMYEASEMDGASVWEQFWKITLPSLKTAIFINLIYTLILLATFDNNGVIMVIKQGMFEENHGYGFSSALAWIYFIVIALIIALLFVIFFVRIKRKPKFHPYIEGYERKTDRYKLQPNFFNSTPTGKKIKRKLLGRNISDGIIVKIFTYALLIVMSFAFLYPFIYLLLKSLQSPDDILNPTVGLIPTSLYFDNFVKAFKTLGFFKALGQSAYLAIIPTILQVVSTSFVGYGLAKFKFKGKKIVFGLIIASFVIPPQILMIPTYVTYSKIGILGSVLTFALPAMFAQGLKNAIFILLFYEFFIMLPRELDEAAMLDGASRFKIFFKVAIPLSVTIFIVAFIFSFVWYWNETYLTSLYIREASTLPMQLSRFAESYSSMYSSASSSGAGGYTDKLNDAIYMAGTLISILPLLLMYFILQKWFVKGIDKTGLGGM